MPHAPAPPGSATLEPTRAARGRFGLRNLASFARDPLAMLERLARADDAVAAIQVAGRPWVLVNHPSGVEEVFVKHARVMGRDRYSRVLERALGKGLLTSDGELWKRQRRLLAPAFAPRRVATYGDTMVQVTANAASALRDGALVNLHHECSRLTLAVVAEVLFGAGVDARDVASVRDSMEVINEFFAQSPEGILDLPPWVPTPRHLRFGRAIATIDALLFRILAERRRATARDDLLGTLLAAQDDDGSRMSDAQLRDEAITLFLAGHETTALALTHTFYLLATHPGVEQRVRAELASVLGDRDPRADDAPRLVYTRRVLDESLRLYPPAWLTGREALEDVTVLGRRVRRGTQVLLSPWTMHRDPRFFRDPLAFDPDRWLPERAAEVPRFAYLPFGGGPRVCIGNHFALLEATLMLATLLRRVHVELVAGERLAFSPSVTLRPRGEGLHARLRAAPSRAEAPAAQSV